MTGETLKAYEQMLAKAYDTGSEDYLTGTRHSWFDVRQAYLRGYDDAKACGQLHELTKR